MDNIYRLFINSGSILTEYDTVNIVANPSDTNTVTQTEDEVPNILLTNSELNKKWEELEIDDLNLSSSFSVEELKDISKRKDKISTDIVIKGTKLNNILLGALYNVDRDVIINSPQTIFTDYKPNRYVDCFILENNVEVMRGKLLITSVNIKQGIVYYNCSVVGTTYSFFSDLNDFKLSDLDSFSIYNRKLNRSLVLGDNGVEYYPLIDYGGKMNVRGGRYAGWDLNGHRWDCFRPAITVIQYIDAIFRGFRYDEANKKYTQLDKDGNPIQLYKLDSRFRNFFKSIVIPNNDASLRKNTYGADASYSRKLRPGEATTYYSYLYSNNSIGMYYGRNNPKTIQSKDSKGFSSLIDQPSDGEYVYDGQYGLFNVSPVNGMRHVQFDSFYSIYGIVKLKGFIGFRFPDLSNKPRVRLVIADVEASEGEGTFDDTKIIWEKDLTNYTSGGGSENARCYIDETITFPKFEGRVAIAMKIDNINVHYNSDLIFDIDLDPAIGANVEVQWDDTFNLQTAIPRDITIKDFLKNIMLLFNMFILQDDNLENVFNFYTYKEFYEDVLNIKTEKAIDWSNKVDFNSYTLNTNIDLPKNYVFRFKDDGDLMNNYYKQIYNESYGQYNLINSVGLTSTQTLELSFSPTITLDWGSGRIVAMMCSGGEIGVDEKKQMKTNMRIAFLSELSPCSNFTLVDMHGATVREEDEDGIHINFVDFNHYRFISMGRFNIIGGELVPIQTLCFGLPRQYWAKDIIGFEYEDQTLYNTFYKIQIRELIDPNLITLSAKAYLNEVDISNLNFRLPIYLKTPYGSAYFKLLKVDYSNSNESSNILLQKIVLPDTNLIE